MTDGAIGQKRTRPDLGRRAFLVAAGGGVLGACGPPPSVSERPETRVPDPGVQGLLPTGKDPRALIVYGYDPLEAETQRDRLTTALTPAAAMFVRQNLPLPDPGIVSDPEAWTFQVEGVVRPGRLRLAELRRMDTVQLTSVIQCSGNGRGFAAHAPEGSPWRVGAVANVEWTGVPVRAVITDRGGPVEGARFLTAAGAEPLPAGVEPREEIVERSVPLPKGLADCLKPARRPDPLH